MKSFKEFTDSVIDSFDSPNFPFKALACGIVVMVAITQCSDEEPQNNDKDAFRSMVEIEYNLDTISSNND